MWPCAPTAEFTMCLEERLDERLNATRMLSGAIGRDSVARFERVLRYEQECRCCGAGGGDLCLQIRNTITIIRWPSLVVYLAMYLHAYRLPSLDLTLPSGYIQAGLMQASIAPMDKTPPTCSDLIEPMPSVCPLVWFSGTPSRSLTERLVFASFGSLSLAHQPMKTAIDIWH